jgi:hypothetical protein
MLDFKLGKSPKKVDLRTFKLSLYLPTLPPLPDSISWHNKISDFLMLGNDRYCDCAIAAAAHAEMVWTSQTSKEFIPSESQVLDDYTGVSGFIKDDPATDAGAVELDVLNKWRKSGICGRIIYAFIETELGNINQIKAGIFLFGSVYLGVKLPQSAMDAFKDGQDWTNTTDTNILGGHAILATGYDADWVYIISWGKVIRVSWKWFTTYVDESYIAISPDWFDKNNMSPGGFNINQLQSDLGSL